MPSTPRLFFCSGLVLEALLLSSRAEAEALWPHSEPSDWHLLGFFALVGADSPKPTHECWSLGLHTFALLLPSALKAPS